MKPTETEERYMEVHKLRKAIKKAGKNTQAAKDLNE